MVIAHEHRAGFNGAHNRSKSKALIILHRQKFTLGDNTPLTVRQIAQESGVSYGFLKVRFSFWANTCHYVIRKPIVNEAGLAMVTRSPQEVFILSKISYLATGYRITLPKYVIIKAACISTGLRCVNNLEPDLSKGTVRMGENIFSLTNPG